MHQIAYQILKISRVILRTHRPRPLRALPQLPKMKGKERKEEEKEEGDEKRRQRDRLLLLVEILDGHIVDLRGI